MARLMVVMLALAAMLNAAPPNVRVVRLPDAGIQPQAVVDRAGTTHVLYFKGEAAHGDLFYARFDRDGSISRPMKVNSRTGSAIATGTMRGGHLAIGRNGQIHVAWHGSDQAVPRATGSDSTPVLYTRMNTNGTAFEVERNVVSRRLEGLDGGTVAADASGNVYVAWHAFELGKDGEADRRVWVARSSDDGRTFAHEEPVSEAATGACGCCGTGALATARGDLFILYRSATDVVHRDTYLLTSRDQAKTFASVKLQEWNLGACPMSSYSLSESASSVLAAWETDGQVQWLRIDPATGTRSSIVTAPGPSKVRKHPVVAGNSRGETLLVWNEGTGWNKGGGLAWQLFNKDGQILGPTSHSEGVPVWGMAAIAVQPTGEFVIVY